MMLFFLCVSFFCFLLLLFFFFFSLRNIKEDDETIPKEKMESTLHFPATFAFIIKKKKKTFRIRYKLGKEKRLSFFVLYHRMLVVCHKKNETWNEKNGILVPF